MRVALKLHRQVILQRPLNRQHVAPRRYAGAVGDPENMRIDRLRGVTEGDVQHHVGGLAANAGKRLQGCARIRHRARVALDQDLAERDDIARLLPEQPDRPDRLDQPLFAKRDHCRRCRGAREKPARGLVHARIGGLSAEHNGNQKREGIGMFQLARRCRIGRLKAAENFCLAGEIKGSAHLPPMPPDAAAGKGHACFQRIAHVLFFGINRRFGVVPDVANRRGGKGRVPMHICYPGGALQRDPVSGSWVFDPGFGPASVALKLEKATPGGVSVLRDAQGRERARGALSYDTPLRLLRGNGGCIGVERVEIGAVTVIVPTEPLEPGFAYLQAEAPAPPLLRFGAAALAQLAALGAGAMIATKQGALPVEWLRPGDKVLTRDHGYRPLLSVARLEGVDARAEAMPFWLPADAFGAHKPQRPLLVTPGQRVLIAAPELRLMFGEGEMLARVDTLAATFGIAPEPRALVPRLFVLICAAQEVVLVDGLWFDTALATPDLLAAFPPSDRATLAQTLGTDHATPARNGLDARGLAALACPALPGRRWLAA